MSDGRAFTQYSPNCSRDVLGASPREGSHARRLALMRGADGLRRQEVQRAARGVMCQPPGAQGTVAGHALEMECDAEVCRVRPRPPGASVGPRVGTARVNTGSPNAPTAFYPSEGVSLGAGVPYSGYA